MRDTKLFRLLSGVVVSELSVRNAAGKLLEIFLRALKTEAAASTPPAGMCMPFITIEIAQILHICMFLD